MRSNFKILTVSKWNDITNLGIHYLCKNKLSILKSIINQKLLLKQDLKFVAPYR